MPNIPETIVAMLAATSIGAIWSSCSPDFGISGVMDRFGLGYEQRSERNPALVMASIVASTRSSTGMV